MFANYHDPFTSMTPKFLGCFVCVVVCWGCFAIFVSLMYSLIVASCPKCTMLMDKFDSATDVCCKCGYKKARARIKIMFYKTILVIGSLLIYLLLVVGGYISFTMDWSWIRVF
jgi:hypothetical protein